MIKLAHEGFFYIRGNRNLTCSIVSDDLTSALMVYFIDDENWLPKKDSYVTIMNEAGRSAHLKVIDVFYDYTINSAQVANILLGDQSLHYLMMTHSVSRLANEVKELSRIIKRKGRG